MTDNKMQKWRDERAVLDDCRIELDTKLTEYQICENRYNIDGLIDDVAGKFGTDTLKQVIASTIDSREGDGRFSKIARMWAEDVDLVKPPIEISASNIQSNLHSCFINSIAERMKKIENYIKIVVVAPLEPPRVEMVENTLEEIQRVVDGYIETVPFDVENPNVFIVCNEDAKLKNFVGNRRIGNDIIAGTFFITKLGADEDFASLSNVEVTKYMGQFKEIEHYTSEAVTQSMYCNLIFPKSFADEYKKKETALINKLDDEYSQFKAKELTSSPQSLFDRAYEIATISDCYNTLIHDYNFDESEIDILLDHRVEVLKDMYNIWMRSEGGSSSTLSHFIAEIIAEKSEHIEDDIEMLEEMEKDEEMEI